MISSSEQALPICEGLNPVEMYSRLDLALIGHMASDPTNITVVFSYIPCWLCKNQFLVFHGAFRAAVLNDQIGDVTRLMYWPDTLRQSDAARKQFGLGEMGTVKPRYSKSAGESYVSQGCPRCDAILGAHWLEKCFKQAAGAFDDPAYPYKMTPSWPPKGINEVVDEVLG